MTTFRKVLAVLITLRAATNFGKPFTAGSRFVVFGHLLGGVFTSIVAPAVGIYMLIYAYGLWQGASWAKPVGIAYALWATANVVLFPVFEPLPGGFGLPAYMLFAVPGIVGPWLAVWLLARGAR